MTTAMARDRGRRREDAGDVEQDDRRQHEPAGLADGEDRQGDAAQVAVGAPQERRDQELGGREGEREDPDDRRHGGRRPEGEEERDRQAVAGEGDDRRGPDADPLVRPEAPARRRRATRRRRAGRQREARARRGGEPRHPPDGTRPRAPASRAARPAGVVARRPRGVASAHARQPARRRDEPVPPPARPQPGRLVSLGTGGAGARAAPGPADLPLDRLRGLPLVPRHGARVVRGPGDRRVPQRALRGDQGGPRGAARPRRRLHGRGPGHDRLGRLADVGLPDARRPPVLRRHVLPEHAPPRHAVLPSTSWPASPSAWRERRAERGGSRRPSLAAHVGRRVAPLRRRGGASMPACSTRPSGPSRPGSTPQHGGWGSAPKFPQPMAIDFLLRRAAAGRRPRAADGAPDPRPDGRGRHLRPAGRRLRPLRDRRGLAGAALREDALRQRPARPRLPPRVGAHRRPAPTCGSRPRRSTSWPAR